jgi:hypothetical protein
MHNLLLDVLWAFVFECVAQCMCVSFAGSLVGCCKATGCAQQAPSGAGCILNS